MITQTLSLLRAKTWLDNWHPEDAAFWKATGNRLAWWTLARTTFALTFSFATWFMVSAIIVRLPGIGFKFDTMQLFWLAAMPGLAGGTLRAINTFLIPLFGTRHVITYTIFLKLIPCIGLGWAIMHPDTPFWMFIVLALLAGIGGGDFSSYMPSTNLFFPQRLKGTALGIQAGIGNFGVSLAQFVTPWIIGFAALGTLGGEPEIFSKGDVTKNIWLQNAAFWYVPFLIFIGINAWLFLRSVPIKASFKEQLDIFGNKHTWFCTIIYVMTFGSFAGLSATFPLMIQKLYGNFPDAPDPLKYAFYGPLIGSALRVLFGFISDKTGGAILTHISGIGLIIGIGIMLWFGLFTPTSLDQFPFFVTMMLVLFFFTGIGNASTFKQFPKIFEKSPRQAGGVLGWTAAIAAYGPFLFSVLIGAAITSVGSPNVFFYGLAVFCLLAVAINWWYYTRKNAEVKC